MTKLDALYNELLETQVIINRIYELDKICVPEPLAPELFNIALESLAYLEFVVEDLIETFDFTDYTCPQLALNNLLLTKQLLPLTYDKLIVINALKETPGQCSQCAAEGAFREMWYFTYAISLIFVATLVQVGGGESND